MTNNKITSTTYISNDTVVRDVTDRDIINMCACIISACIQKGVPSVLICDIKKFFQNEIMFDAVWRKVVPYLTSHFEHGPDVKYSIGLKRKLFDDTIISGMSIVSCIKKSDGYY